MSEPQTKEQARNAIEEILSALGVARVVCVDDTYSDEPTLEDVLVAARLEPDILKDVLPELGGSIPDDQDVLRNKIRLLWTEFDSKMKLIQTMHILAAERRTGNANPDDPGNASILAELVPKTMLQTLSPKEWEVHCNRLLEEDLKYRTLFLFDQNLSQAGGEMEGGIKIIASLLARADVENLICGLLTHTVTPEEQPEKWEELSKTYNIPRDRFLVIPKLYLSKDPILFAQVMKLVALSPDFTQLKRKTSEIIIEASSKATDSVDAINIYDLDHMVFRVSTDEGLWEPDMLFRLHALFHRLESRKMATQRGELEKIAGRLRLVSHIPTDTAFKIASATWNIQKKDVYESEDYLNENYLPLELGDIFIKTGKDSKKRYILLAQPCDLMVRNDGKREPEIVHVPIAEITSSRPYYGVELAYYGNPNEQWFVNLRQVHQIPVWLLDLCVFNNDGSATMSLTEEAPDAIRPSWKRRYVLLQKQVAHRLKLLDALSLVKGEDPKLVRAKQKLKSELMVDILNMGIFKGKLVSKKGENRVVFNCSRIGRLSRDRAFGLLMGYTGFLCRPAYEVSLDNKHQKGAEDCV
jgi:hypothetical protein